MSKEYFPNLVDTLDEAIGKLEHLIESNGEPNEDDDFVDLSSGVLDKLSEVLGNFELAKNQATCVNWFLKGDDDEQTFLSKIEDFS